MYVEHNWRAIEASKTLSGDVQSRIMCGMCGKCDLFFRTSVTYFFAQVSNFTCRTVSWGGFMTGTLPGSGTLRVT